MPLNQATLLDGILSITDPSRSGHTWPSTPAEVGQRWAAAARAYFAEALQPVPLPPALDAGASAMAAVLSVSFAPGAAVAAFPAAWQAFAATFAAVLTPAVALPPPAPPVIPPLPPVTDPMVPAVAIAGAIDAWARTGLAAIPPTPPSVPWS